MHPHPDVIRVTVAVRTLWKCRSCDAVQSGDAITAEFDFIPARGHLRGLQRACHMPVGWSSYGTAGVECPVHGKN